MTKNKARSNPGSSVNLPQAQALRYSRSLKTPPSRDHTTNTNPKPRRTYRPTAFPIAAAPNATSLQHHNCVAEPHPNHHTADTHVITQITKYCNFLQYLLGSLNASSKRTKRQLLFILSSCQVISIGASSLAGSVPNQSATSRQAVLPWPGFRSLLTAIGSPARQVNANPQPNGSESLHSGAWRRSVAPSSTAEHVFSSRESLQPGGLTWMGIYRSEARS